MGRGEEGEGCWGTVDLVGEGEGAKDYGDEGAGGLCPHCLVGGCWSWFLPVIFDLFFSWRLGLR